MAFTIERHRRDGFGYTERYGTGPEIIERFHVRSDAPATDYNAPNPVENLAIALGLIPSPADPYDIVGYTDLICIGRTVQGLPMFEGPSNLVTVDLSFARANESEQYAPVDTVIDASVGTVQATKLTTRDAFGAEHKLDYSGIDSSGYKMTHTTLEWERNEATSVIRVARIEANWPTGDAGNQSFRNKTNNAPHMGYATDTLLITAVDAQRIPGRPEKRVDYEFAHDPAGWKHVAKVRLSNLIPSDADPINNGEKTITIYGQYDPGLLGIQLP